MLMITYRFFKRSKSNSCLLQHPNRNVVASFKRAFSPNSAVDPSNQPPSPDRARHPNRSKGDDALAFQAELVSLTGQCLSLGTEAFISPSRISKHRPLSPPPLIHRFQIHGARFRTRQITGP